MTKKRISNKFDYGTQRVTNEEISDYSFVACGLSLGIHGRSEFRDCLFSNIEVKKCSVGFPIFRSCRFENIVSDRNGVLVYGAGFTECTFSGLMKNIVIGFMGEHVPVSAEHSQQTKEYQAQNLEIAAKSKFAIDITDADTDFVAFRGEAIIPYVRCARNQAIILQANNLHEKLVRLGRSQSNRAKSDFYLSTGVLPESHSGIATFNQQVREYITEIERELHDAGVELIHYDTPKVAP